MSILHHNRQTKLQALLLACLLWCIVELRTTLAFAAPNTVAGTAQSCASASSEATTTAITDPQLVLQRIQSGRVYVHQHFLSEEQLQLLQRDMNQLEADGKFVVNGLSDVRKGLKGEPTTAAENRNKSNQGFQVKYDRSVCPIPWWKDSFSLSVEAGSGDSGVSSESNDVLLHSVQTRLQRLRADLSEILGRPTMMNNELDHECYYSQSAPGSSLARHMDERHEETKGPRGWLLPSRRSLSWLIYLSETDEKNEGKEWDAQINGGLLRTFPQKSYRNNERSTDVSSCGDTADCGQHDGNLQVGWQVATGDKQSTHPVFLDSWYDHINPYTGVAEPHCILYMVRKASKEYITAPWSIDALGGANAADFLQHHAQLESNRSAGDDSPALFLQSAHAKQFRLLEDRDAWTKFPGEMPAGSIQEEILPIRGTLVVFDSVSLPHEVTAVLTGKRAALAGWFHEETQPLGGKCESFTFFGTNQPTQLFIIQLRSLFATEIISYQV